MPNLYNDIPGFFDFEVFYDEMVDKFPNGHFVEVGCWFGKSSVYLLEKIKEENVNIIVDFVDTWEGQPNVEFQLNVLKEKDVYAEFLNNIHKADPNYSGQVWKTTSVLAAQEYEDASLDAIFLDDDHRYEFIYAGIQAWLPKVKNGGYLAGHDFEQDSVDRAVKELLPTAIKKCDHGHVWCYNKKLPIGLKELI